MNVRRLALVGGTAAWVVSVATYVRRKRRTRVPFPPQRASVAGRLIVIAGAFVAFAQTRAGLFGFDPGAVWGGIWNVLGNFGSDIKSWVLEAIQKAADVLTGFINTVDDVYRAITNTLTGGFDWLVDHAVNAAEAVAHVTEVTLGFIDEAFANFREQAKAMLEHAYDDVKKYVLDTVWAGLDAFVRDVINAGDWFAGLVTAIVLGAVDALWEIIGPWVQQLIDQALSIAGFTWDAFWGLFWPALADQLGVPDNPLDILRGAWWLLKLARDVASGDFETALRDAVNGSYDYFLTRARGEVAKWDSVSIDDIARSMGVTA